MTRSVGVVSETFIARHARDLEPDDTVVVSKYGLVHDPAWLPTGPHLVLQPSDVATRARLVSTKAVALLRGLPVNYWTPTSAQRRALRQFLDVHGVEVVLAEFLDLWVGWMPVLRDAGVRVVLHAHGHDLSARWREPRWRQLYEAYEGADVVVVNEEMRHRLMSIGLSASRIHRIPYGVDVPDAPTGSDATETIECLAVGRLVPKKAPLVTLEAFARTRSLDPRLRLTMVGAGPLENRVHEAVRRFGVEGSVDLLGSQPPGVVQTLLARCDVFLQHSITGPDGDEEGLPVGILEAMAHGVPVISTRHAGIPEAVVDGETGLLVAPMDISGMADALAELAHDAAARSAMGYRAWQRAKERFSWPVEREALRRVLAGE